MHTRAQMKTLQFRESLALACCVSLMIANLLPAQEVKAPEAPAAAKWPGDDQFPGTGPIQNAEWFQNLWAKRRTEFWHGRAQDKGAVVFVGDSITQGWGSLARDFPNLKVANRGISGDTTRGVLYRLKEDVLDLKPAAVVLLIGTNDIGLGGEPADAAANTKAILAALRESNPRTPVIVCKVMPSDASKNRPTEKLQRLNALVDEIVQADPQMIRCDTWSIFADESGNAKKEQFPDLLHPNPAGYAKWAKTLKPVFDKLKLVGGAHRGSQSNRRGESGWTGLHVGTCAQTFRRSGTAPSPAEIRLAIPAGHVTL
jgi:lysophospholipase L1-like esterase